MGEVVDDVGRRRQEERFRPDRVTVVEMQSEAGAAGAVHGSLAAGALTTTFTASQGLLLMIPNMYKIAGELLPAVFHVCCPCPRHPRPVHLRRPSGRHGLPSDRLLPCSARNSVQECHGSRLWSPTFPPSKSSVPLLHFFDGFRTSHEIQKIEVIDYDDIRKLVTWDAVAGIPRPRYEPRASPIPAAPPRTPTSIFQNVEAANSNLSARARHRGSQHEEGGCPHRT